MSGRQPSDRTAASNSSARRAPDRPVSTACARAGAATGRDEAGELAGQVLELYQRVVGGHEDRNVLRAGFGEPRQRRRARAGRSPPPDAARRSERGARRATPSTTGLVLGGTQPPTDTNATVARATVPGSRPTRSASLSRRPSAARVLVGGKEQRDPSVPAPRRAAQGGLTGPADPYRDRPRGGQLRVALAGGDLPRSAEDVDPLVEKTAPGGKSTPGRRVLAGVGADADTEDEPAPDKWASVAASLATDGAWRSGNCKTHVPMAARRVAAAATPNALRASSAGPCQKRWSHTHSAPAPAGLGSRGTARPGRPCSGGRARCWGKVGRMRPRARGARRRHVACGRGRRVGGHAAW